MMEVEYRDIAGFPGYRVGSDGSVWSRRTHTATSGRSVSALRDEWKNLKPWPTGKAGYLAVYLMRDAKRVPRKVYRLVLEAFVGPAPENCCACHNDGDTSNNCLTNLRWDSVVNNSADKRSHGTLLQGEAVKSSKITADIAREIKRLIQAGERNCDIARRLGVTDKIVRRIRRCQTWKHVA
jgi:hypothetical protein